MLESRFPSWLIELCALLPRLARSVTWPTITRQAVAARSLTFVAVAVVIALWLRLSEVIDKNDEIARIALTDISSQELALLVGPTLDRFLSCESCISRGFRSTSDDFEGSALLFLSTTTREGLLVSFHLPPLKSPYVVRTVDADGRIENRGIIRRYKGTMAVVALQCVEVEGFASLTWQILTARGAIVLSTA